MPGSEGTETQDQERPQKMLGDPLVAVTTDLKTPLRTSALKAKAEPCGDFLGRSQEKGEDVKGTRADVPGAGEGNLVLPNGVPLNAGTCQGCGKRETCAGCGHAWEAGAPGAARCAPSCSVLESSLPLAREAAHEAEGIAPWSPVPDLLLGLLEPGDIPALLQVPNALVVILLWEGAAQATGLQGGLLILSAQSLDGLVVGLELPGPYYRARCACSAGRLLEVFDGCIEVIAG